MLISCILTPESAGQRPNQGIRNTHSRKSTAAFTRASCVPISRWNRLRANEHRHNDPCSFFVCGFISRALILNSNILKAVQIQYDRFSSNDIGSKTRILTDSKRILGPMVNSGLVLGNSTWE